MSTAEILRQAVKNFTTYPVDKNKKERVLKGISELTTPQRERIQEILVYHKPAILLTDETLAKRLIHLYNAVKSEHEILEEKDSGRYAITKIILNIWRDFKDLIGIRISDEKIFQMFENYNNEQLQLENQLNELKQQVKARLDKHDPQTTEQLIQNAQKNQHYNTLDFSKRNYENIENYYLKRGSLLSSNEQENFVQKSCYQIAVNGLFGNEVPKTLTMADVVNAWEKKKDSDKDCYKFVNELAQLFLEKAEQMDTVEQFFQKQHERAQAMFKQ